MATLTELHQEVDPAGDFYAWILKRYQRAILTLVLFLAALMIGLGVLAFWFDSRLSSIEEQVERSPATVEGPSLDEWRQSVTDSAERDAALQRKVTAMAGCLNQNLDSFNVAMDRLLLGRMQVREFVTGFKLRACG